MLAQMFGGRPIALENKGKVYFLCKPMNSIMMGMHSGDNESQFNHPMYKHVRHKSLKQIF